MADTKLVSTNNRFLALFSGSTILNSSSTIFGGGTNGYTASATTFQFTKGFVSSGGSALIEFLGAGVTFTLPSGLNRFDDAGIAIGSFTGCTGVSVTCSGGNAIIEFKGIPTNINENYFK